MIGDLIVLHEMIRAEARQQDQDEENDMRELFVWLYTTAFLAIACLMLKCLWSMSGSLAEIAGKL